MSCMKKNVGKLAGKSTEENMGNPGDTDRKGRYSVTVVKGKLSPSWHQGDSWLFFPHSASPWAPMSPAEPPAAQGWGIQNFPPVFMHKTIGLPGWVPDTASLQ